MDNIVASETLVVVGFHRCLVGQLLPHPCLRTFSESDESLEQLIFILVEDLTKVDGSSVKLAQKWSID